MKGIDVFLAQKVVKYMGWLSIKCTVFKDRDESGRSIGMDDVITNVCVWVGQEHSTVAILDICDIFLCDMDHNMITHLKDIILKL